MYAARDNGTRVRIMRHSDVSSDPLVETELLDGAGYTDVYGQSGESLVISSSRPVLVAQLCKSNGADAVNRSDPFMSLLPPIIQYANGYNFTTLDYAYTEYDNFVGVIAPSTGEWFIRLIDRSINQ